LVEWTARFAGIDPEQLDDRCTDDPRRVELLLRVLRATSNTSLRGKVIAYALSLAEGTEPMTDERGLAWEAAFVRALDDLDEDHLLLLDRFTHSGNDLGLGDGSEAFESPPEALNDAQLETAAEGIVNLPSVIAVLQRNGLVRPDTGVGASYGGSTAFTNWRLTQFGREVLERLAVIRELVSTAVTDIRRRGDVPESHDH
jgi:hypothetical protein